MFPFKKTRKLDLPRESSLPSSQSTQVGESFFDIIVILESSAKTSEFRISVKTEPKLQSDFPRKLKSINIDLLENVADAVRSLKEVCQDENLVLSALSLGDLVTDDSGSFYSIANELIKLMSNHQEIRSALSNKATRLEVYFDRDRKSFVVYITL